MVPRELWRKAGDAGLLCPNVPDGVRRARRELPVQRGDHGGAGRAGATGPQFTVHSDMVATYILSFGNEAQKTKWLPKMVSGEIIGAIGLTEPGGGSDLKAMRTRALRDGDDYVINGQKTYISNGQLCDIVVLACKTDPEAGAKGVSLIVVETDRPGFERGRRLEKLGLKAQDTSELFFNDVRVPVANRLGEEGAGFKMAMHKLAHERLIIAVNAVATMRGGDRLDGELHAGAQGLRQADRRVSEHPLQGGGACGARAERAGVRRSLHRACGRRTSWTAPMPPWRRWLRPSCSAESSTNACSSSAGTGIRSTTRLRTPIIDARVRRIAGGSSEVMREIVSRRIFQG